jgi:hypothetical protein
MQYVGRWSFLLHSNPAKEEEMKKAAFAFMILIVLSDAAFAGVSVLGGLTREVTLDPGDSHESTIQLYNNSEEAIQVNVFQTDYSFYADGSTHYDNPGSTPRSNAGWISFSPSRVTIPAGATVSIYFEMNTPASSDLSGTYWSVLMIKPVSLAAPPDIEERDGKIVLGVQTVIRYAIQMITNIGETGKSDVRLSSHELVRIDGKRILRTELENTGERWLSPDVWLELYGEDGNYVGRFKSERKRIFPSCSVSHLLDLDEVPIGRYTALIIVDNRDDRVFGATYEVRLD